MPQSVISPDESPAHLVDNGFRVFPFEEEKAKLSVVLGGQARGEAQADKTHAWRRMAAHLARDEHEFVLWVSNCEDRDGRQPGFDLILGHGQFEQGLRPPRR